jgi:hypothetical protein
MQTITIRWIDALEASRTALLESGPRAEARLAQAAGARMITAWALDPAPRDPVRHLEVAHTRARAHLADLARHDAALEVPSVMTGELFARLTAPTPAPLRAPERPQRYTYTPRKSLRRVLDHCLDHLNQIDQWRAWRDHGIVPVPTDGWVPSTVTLPDDRLPLAPRDLDAWLWRIDQAARLLQQRAESLSADELDWPPPDGGWPLRRVLHHVARTERLYAAALDEALPAADARGSFLAAGEQLSHAMGELARHEGDASVVFPGLYGVLRSPAEIIDDLLNMEKELLA